MSTSNSLLSGIVKNEIFLSYAKTHADIDFVRLLDRAIRDRGCDPWIDWDDMPANIQEDQRYSFIKQGISEADIFVFIISPDFISDERSIKELEIAQQAGKFLIPLVWRSPDPTLISPELKSELENENCLTVGSLDLHSEADRLAKAIVYMQIYARLLIRATDWNNATKDSEKFNLLLRRKDLEQVQEWKLLNNRLKPEITSLQKEFIEASKTASRQQVHGFVSYSGKDREFVLNLHQKLSDKDLNIWLDKSSIPVATDWWEEIKEGIATADNFIFVATPDSVNSINCQAEIAHAIRYGKRLILITLGWKPISTRAITERFQSKTPFEYKGDLFYKKAGEMSVENLVSYQDIGSYLDRVQKLEFAAQEYDSSLFLRSSNKPQYPISQLIEAIQSDEDYVREHTWYLGAARRWKDSGQKNLLRGEDLKNAQKWLNIARTDSKEPRPTSLQEEYIEASAKAAEAELLKERQKQLRERKNRQIIASIMVGSILAIGGISFSLFRSVGREINALVNALEDTRGLDTLITALDAGDKLRSWGGVVRATDSILTTRVITVLNQELNNLKELNRLGGEIGHQNTIFNVSFSPDGRYFATASADNSVKLWGRDGQLIETLFGHKEGVVSSIFSPDGQILASASYDANIKLWEVPTGKLIKTLDKPEGHIKQIYAISFSPGGQFLASASEDGTVKVWNRSDNFTQPITLDHQNSPVYALSFSRFGEQIVTASADGKVRIWNRQDGFTSPIIRRHSRNPVLTIAFSPNGETIASADSNGTIAIWTAEGRLIWRKKVHDASINRLVFSPNSQLLISASDDGTAKVWQQRDGWKNPISKVLRGHQGSVLRAAFSRDGMTIATASEDRTIKLWDLGVVQSENFSGYESETLEGHEGRITGIEFSPDREAMASVSHDETVRLWKVKNSIQVLPHSNEVNDISFRPRSQEKSGTATQDELPSNIFVASAGFESIRLWRGDGTPLDDATSELKGRNNIWSVQFNPRDRNMLASSGEDGYVRLWEISNRATSEQIIQKRQWLAHRAGTFIVRFHPSGKLIVTGGQDGRISLWRTDGTFLKTLKEDFGDYVSSLEFDLKGKQLAAAGENGLVMVWNFDSKSLSTKSTYSEIPKSDEAPKQMVHGMSFSRDGRIALARENGSIEIRSADGRTLVHTMASQNNSPAVELDFSLDGNVLAVGNQGGTIELWATQNGQLITTLKEHRADVYGVAYSPNGTFLASSSKDTRVILRQLSNDSSEDALNNLIRRGCKLVRNYLDTSGNQQYETHFCKREESSN